MSQSNASDLARCLEVVELTTHARVLTLETTRDRLQTVAVRTRCEADRIASFVLPVVPGDGAMAALLGLDDAAEALADDQTAAKVQAQALEMLAQVASSGAASVQATLEELLAPLSGTSPAPSAPPVEPVMGPLVLSTCECGRNGTCHTQCVCECHRQPLAEEVVTIAANSTVAEAPTSPLTPAWIASHSPDNIKSTTEFVEDGPPDDDDTSADEEDVDEEDNEGTDIDKATVNELAQEVFGEPVSASDEARARVISSYPDAECGDVQVGRNRTYYQITATVDGRRRRIGGRKAAEAGAWQSAAATLS